VIESKNLDYRLSLWQGDGTSEFFSVRHHGWGLRKQLDGYPMIMLKYT